MDFDQIMRMAAQVREQMAGLSSRAADSRVTGEAGGGLVRVVMNGKHEVLEVHIDPKAVASDELGLLEDLLRAAFNQASGRAGDALKEHLGQMAQMLGLDPALLSGFPGVR